MKRPLNHSADSSLLPGSALQRIPRVAPSDQRSHPLNAEQILSLQSTAGNKAVGRLLGGETGHPVPLIQRMKLSSTTLKEEDVSFKPYHSGSDYYMMIDNGDSWHISIPVNKNLKTWPAQRNHDFNAYHVTDPNDNHYWYRSNEYCGSSGTGPFHEKTAHALVHRLLKVQPTIKPDPLEAIRNYRLGLIGSKRYKFCDLFNSCISRLKVKLGGEPGAFAALRAHDIGGDNWLDLETHFGKNPEWTTFEAEFKPPSLNVSTHGKRRRETELDDPEAGPGKTDGTEETEISHTATAPIDQPTESKNESSQLDDESLRKKTKGSGPDSGEKDESAQES